MQPVQVLNLSNDSFERLPARIGKLEILQSVNLSGCECLKALPTCIKRLKGLQTLNLEGCTQLQQLPVSVWRLPNLQVTLRACSYARASGFLELLEELAIDSGAQWLQTLDKLERHRTRHPHDQRYIAVPPRNSTGLSQDRCMMMGSCDALPCSDVWPGALHATCLGGQIPSAEPSLRNLAGFF